MSQEKPLRRSREGLESLAVRQVLRATAGALSLEEILAVIANMTIIVFDATTAWLMLATDRLRTVVARGECAEGLAGTTCCLAAAAERPTVLQPEQINATHPVLGALGSAGQPVALVPLVRQGQLLGLLGAVVPPEAAGDIAFLVTVAELASTAIETARLRQESRTWHDRLDAVFEKMAEPVLVFSQAGTLTLMNTAAQEVLAERGVRLGDAFADVARKAGLGDAQGRPLPPERMAAARALRGEQVDNLEEVLPAGDGTQRHLLASAAPLGAGQGVVVVWRDITYIKEFERMRAEFLSMVSHELRSPLTSLLGFAQLLEREGRRGTPRDLPRRLAIIAEQSRRLNALVDDLLNIARAEVERFQLDLEQVDLAALVAGVVADAGASVPTCRIELAKPPSLPTVTADPGRIRQVLTNLLSNAAKYSPPHAHIRVQLQAEDGRVIVAVADEGMGIAKDDIAGLFIPFQRRRNAEKRGIQGLGLGLYISRSIIEAHGGEMWVHSELHKGSTFYFSLPVMESGLWSKRGDWARPTPSPAPQSGLA